MASKIGLFVLLWISVLGSAAAQQLPWTIIANGTLTTSSQIYLFPDATDPVARSVYTDLTSFFGYGMEIRYHFPDTHVAVGVSADYSRATSQQPLSSSIPVDIPVADGYRALTIEGTGYFLIPFSGSGFGVFMGGGIGGYFGKRTYTLGDTEAPLVGWTPGFGIHVLAGVSVHFTERLSVLGEMKFRDLQFSSTNQFRSSPVIYQGTQIRVDRTPFNSNVHTDGITFQIGLGFSM